MSKIFDGKTVSRRGFLKVLGGGMVLTLAGESAFGAEKLCYEYLMVNLYPKTEAEKEYLHQVITAVENRKIPEKAVYAAVKYSVKKKKTERFFYFTETLPILCQRMGIKCPVKKPDEGKDK